MVATAEKSRKKLSKPPISLESLVYETLGGKPLYYRGYKEALAGKKTKEEIMSCSSFQSTLVTLLVLFLGSRINRKKYLINSNEAGLHLSKNNNLGLDLAIFDKENLPQINEKFFDVPPKIVIEVDIKAEIELSDFPAKEMDYIFEKSQKLLDFGVEKVIWITTRTRKVFLATKTDTWIIIDWHMDFELMEGHQLNIKQLLDDEGIDYQGIQ